MLHESVKKFAPVLGEPAVEAESEFVEIRLEVRGGDGSLMGAAQPAFKQGDDQVNMVEFATGRLASGGDDVGMVIKPGGLEPVINREAIAHHQGARLHVVPDEQLDVAPIDRLHTTKADPAKFFPCLSGCVTIFQ